MITATQLLNTLLNKHSEDVCVSECKTGASYGPTVRIMDLWAMKKSWAHPTTYGYEIKVGRQDFLRDQKWRDYLAYCNEFYFVCPPGIIAPEELPPEAGLLVSSANGIRLFTRKKAPHRDVKIPESLFRYVLMCRCRITRDIADTAKYWEDFIQDKTTKQGIGHTAGWKIRNEVEKRVKEVMEESARVRRQNNDLESVKQFIERNGLSLDSTYRLNNSLRSFATEARTGMPEGFQRYVDQAVSNLQQIQGIINDRMAG